MGIQDRDYYREEQKRREAVYDPKLFRGGRVSRPTSGGWFGVVVKTVVICLAVYGSLALVRDLRTGSKPWQSPDPEKVQRLLPYLSGK